MKHAPIDEKLYRTLQARACLLGAVLTRTSDDAGDETFIVARGPYCKELEDAAAVEAWLKRAGGPPA